MRTLTGLLLLSVVGGEETQIQAVVWGCVDRRRRLWVCCSERLSGCVDRRRCCGCVVRIECVGCFFGSGCVGGFFGVDACGCVIILELPHIDGSRIFGRGQGSCHRAYQRFGRSLFYHSLCISVLERSIWIEQASTVLMYHHLLVRDCCFLSGFVDGWTW